MSYKTRMNGSGESSDGIVPAKQPNENQGGLQEAVEGRPSAKKNTEQSHSYRTQSWESESSGSRSGWSDVGRIWRRSDGKASRPVRTNPSRSISSATVTASLDHETGMDGNHRWKSRRWRTRSFSTR